MIRIGLTGLPGVGKTKALSIFSHRGVTVIDTDDIVHELLQDQKSDIYDLLTKRYGNTIIRKDGAIDRKKMAERIFKSSGEVSSINSLLHPEVKKRLIKIMAESSCAVAAEVPLLFEAGWQDLFDITVCITCDDTVRKARNRHNDYEQRCRYHYPQATKAAMAMYSIDNSSNDTDMLTTEIVQLCDTLGIQSIQGE